MGDLKFRTRSLEHLPHGGSADYAAATELALEQERQRW
jgi:hypothetical protein